MSGSAELRADYDRLKQEQERAMDNSTFNFNKKRGINAEIRQYREQRDEAVRFEGMLEERRQLVVRHVLWRLFHIERDVQVSICVCCFVLLLYNEVYIHIGTASASG